MFYNICITLLVICVQEVLLLSNCHGNEMSTIKRREGAEKIDVDCPGAFIYLP